MFTVNYLNIPVISKVTTKRHMINPYMIILAMYKEESNAKNKQSIITT